MKHRIQMLLAATLLAGASGAWAQSADSAKTQIDEQKLADILVQTKSIAPGGTMIFRGDGNNIAARSIAVGDPNAPTARIVLTSSTAKEKAAYFGVAATPVMPALREQLGLKKGVGVLIDRVEDGSPAQLAGIKQYDVIEKLDDQLLINGQQLAVLVRIHSPGEEIKLSIIRQGQRQTLSAKLVEKEVPVLDEQNLWGMPGPVGDATPLAATPFRKMGNGIVVLPNGRSASNIVAKMSDAVYEYNLNYTDGNARMKTTDKQGVVVFDGPVDTSDQIDQAPADIRDQIRRFLSETKTFRTTSTTKPAR